MLSGALQCVPLELELELRCETSEKVFDFPPRSFRKCNKFARSGGAEFFQQPALSTDCIHLRSTWHRSAKESPPIVSSAVLPLSACCRYQSDFRRCARERLAAFVLQGPFLSAAAVVGCNSSGHSVPPVYARVPTQGGSYV